MPPRDDIQHTSSNNPNALHSLTSGASTNRYLITNAVFNITNHLDPHASTPSLASIAGFEKLYAHVSPSAFYNTDDSDHIKCHPGTRTAPLHVLKEWALTRPDPTTGVRATAIVWLNGPAGAGKTAISRSLAEHCDSLSQLAGAFFFWRTGGSDADERRLVPTLAYQLVLAIPQLRPLVEDIVNRDPALFTKSLKHQLQSLIIGPLTEMKRQNPGMDVHLLPRLIIIDGLDECAGFGTRDAQTRSHQLVLEVLQLMASQQTVFPFRILIVSRKEHHIQNFFSTPSIQALVLHLVLDESFSPDQDIELYVTHEFRWIKENHPDRQFLPSGWPSAELICMIVHRSSGQFIYAATVMKYLRTRRYSPSEAFDSILGGAPLHDDSLTAFRHLDELYHQILSSAANVRPAVWAIAFQLIHKTTLASGNTLSLPITEIEKAISFPPGSFHHSLLELSSLVDFSEMPFSIKFYHSSLIDFFTDKQRARNRYVSIRACAEYFALLDLMQFSKAESLDEQHFWFSCFCEALSSAFPSPRLRDALTRTWNSLSTYPTGLEFVKNSKWHAGANFNALSKAYQEMNFPDKQTLLAHLNRSFSSVLQLLVAPYKTHCSLYSLFLIHALDPGWEAPSQQKWCKQLRADIEQSLFAFDMTDVDKHALYLRGSDPDKIWLRALLPEFYLTGNGRSMSGSLTLKDEAILTDAAIYMLELLTQNRGFWTDYESLCLVFLFGKILESSTPNSRVQALMEDTRLPMSIQSAFKETGTLALVRATR